MREYCPHVLNMLQSFYKCFSKIPVNQFFCYPYPWGMEIVLQREFLHIRKQSPVASQGLVIVYMRIVFRHNEYCFIRISSGFFAQIIIQGGVKAVHCRCKTECPEIFYIPNHVFSIPEILPWSYQPHIPQQNPLAVKDFITYLSEPFC